MKKSIVIFFCLQVLSGNTFAMEILKLPLLIQHYFEHENSEHPNLGFGTYLWEHYVDDTHDDEDGHCDEKIPFKHCHDCCSHHTAVITCLAPETSVVHLAAHPGEELNFIPEQNFLSFYSCCIWQPPQLA